MAKQHLTAIIGADTRGFRRGMRSVKRLAATTFQAVSIVGAAGATALGLAIKEAFAQETLLVRLAKLTGGMDAAKEKFKELAEFAAKTPNSLNEVVDSFIRLEGAGFNINLDDFRALGDLAAASNKSLEELVNAMISAGRGQAAMVDNFIGLAGKAEGGALTLENAMTGMRVEGVKSKDEILAFFRAAGQGDKVAGSMEDLSKTGAGAMSTLKDNIAQAMAEIGGGSGRQAVDIINSLTANIQQLRDSGELTKLGDNLAEAVKQIMGIQDEGQGLVAVFEGLNAELAKMNESGDFAAIRDVMVDLARVLGGIAKIFLFIRKQTVGAVQELLGNTDLAEERKGAGMTPRQRLDAGGFSTDTFAAQAALSTASFAVSAQEKMNNLLQVISENTAALRKLGVQ